VLRRRFFFAQIAAGGFAALSFARRTMAQAGLRFRPLARPTAVPLEDMAVSWRARPFVADGMSLSSAANPNQPIRVSGMIVRIGEAGGAGGAGKAGGAGGGGNGASGTPSPDQFNAVCLRCPHEGCDVEFVRDPKTQPPEAFAELPAIPTEPVFICPCHNSTFKASDGERLGGPAPRGLYRFHVTAVTDKTVEIGEVEEDVLLFA
jgi:Rieske Fe-S protein